MSDAFDEFFDDEQELMSAEEPLEGGTSADEVSGGESVPFKGENASPKKAGKDEHAAAQEAATDEGVATQGAATATRAATEGAAKVERASDRKAAKVAKADKAKNAPAPSAPASGRQAPPFWMVLAIAGVSLVLGVVIGYLVGTSATIAELGATAGQSASVQDGGEDGSVSMPEGHPDIDVDEDGTASVAAGTDVDDAAGEDDPLTRANNFFDMGMAAMESAQDEESKRQAAGLFAQAVEYYDEYLAMASSSSAEVDRAICVFYSGDHEGAIADLEALVKRDSTFAPAWANLGMFYESHGDTAKAKKAYQQALDAAKKEDTYGVKDYAQQRLDALSE
ncbi:tetratricopeptide repeat protein [Collinsella stercoris]|uniref:tetratricopeptide repeat protein n=1 Tax=Collinsella stercoris TaxID=147206 RepID=UPI003AF07FD3